MTQSKVELTTKQVAQRLGVNVTTVRRWIHSGKLDARQVDDWLWLIDARSVERVQSGRRAK